MVRVKVVAPFTIVSGKVLLNERQADIRSRFLKTIDAKKGLYETMVPINFKVGEVIGIEKLTKESARYVEAFKE